MDPNLIFTYFPELSDVQKEQFIKLVLHSLGIAKVQQFLPKAEILDVGTGGGFPGIPLAILFPETSFTLVDSIGKKIKVVQEVAAGLELENVVAINKRVEALEQQYDFIVSRAVAIMPTFVHWVKGKIKKESVHQRRNGILYLKGGDLSEELKSYHTVEQYLLTDYFKEDFFETKKVVYLPLKYKG